MNIKLFPILAFSSTDKDFEVINSNGTAFLIDDIGHFYTAGHNFYKKERGKNPEKLTCFALINEKLFPTQEIYIDYDQESEVIKKDFAFGKITNFTNIPDTKTIDCNTPITLGYSKKDLDFEKIETVKWNEKEFKLYKVPISIGTNSIIINKNFIAEFENVLFYKTQPSISLEGLSGGPVLYDNEIQGVLISTCFIIKAYIDKVLNSKK